MKGDASPFDFPGDARGVLCIHGFTGTPFEMRFLGERLRNRGFTAVAPALPGHCTTVEDLNGTTWRDWFDAVETAFDALRRRCEQVSVVGLSMGGLLALHLARSRGAQLRRLAVLATPLWLGPLATGLGNLYRWRPSLHSLMPAVPKLGGGSDIRDPIMKRRNPGYDQIPMRAFHELQALQSVVRSELAEITTQTLVLHGRHDHTAPFSCAAHLQTRLGGGRGHVRRRDLPGSYHLVTLDIERDIVARDIERFFA